MLKGFDNHFTSQFKNITEGFTVDEDIPGLDNKSNNPTINNDSEIQSKLENMKLNTNNKPSKMPMDNNSKMPMDNNSKIHLDILKNMAESNKKIINKQDANNEKEASKLMNNNKRREELNNNYIRNEIQNNKLMNNNVDMQNNNVIEVNNVIEEEDNSEPFDNVLQEDYNNEFIPDEEIIEEEADIEAFTTHMGNIKEGFMGSKIINNQNNRTLLLTILITFFSYIMCHQTTKNFVKSNIKSLDKLLNLENMLNNNVTVINLLLFGIAVFILLQIL